MAQKTDRLLLKDWLKQKLDANAYENVKWTDRAAMIFKIPWRHQSHGEFRKEDGDIFKDWSQSSGYYKNADTQADWKSRFRSALNKSPYVKEIERFKDESGTPYKVFQIQDVVEHKRKRQVSRHPVAVAPEANENSVPQWTSREVPIPSVVNDEDHNQIANDVWLCNDQHRPVQNFQPHPQQMNGQHLSATQPQYAQIDPNFAPGIFQDVLGKPPTQDMAMSEDQTAANNLYGIMQEDMLDIVAPDHGFGPSPVCEQIANPEPQLQNSRKTKSTTYHSIEDNFEKSARTVDTVGDPAECHVPNTYQTNSLEALVEHMTNNRLEHCTNKGGLAECNLSVTDQKNSLDIFVEDMMNNGREHLNTKDMGYVELLYFGKTVLQRDIQGHCQIGKQADVPENGICMPEASAFNDGVEEKISRQASIILGDVNFQGGIDLEIKGGNIFMTRRCLSHVFFSNFKNPTCSYKLERHKKTCVFDCEEFLRQLQEFQATKQPQCEVYLGIAKKYYYGDTSKVLPVVARVKSREAQRALDQIQLSENLGSLQISEDV